MCDLFARILDMSVMGSMVILVTVLTRFVLRKSSKKYVMVLWVIVALRLLVPVSFESALSVFNYIPHKVFATEATEVTEVTAATESAEVTEVTAATAEKAAETVGEVPMVAPSGEPGMVEPAKELVTLGKSDVADVSDTPVVAAAYKHAATGINYRMVATGVWGAGVVAAIGYCVIRFAILKKKLKDATRIEGNVYESEKVDSPFVFGLVAPKIFLPEVLESDEREYILMHEKTHIKYGDWISKMIGMAVVAIHWFNPIVWLGYALFEQDLEMRCDENTVKGMDRNLKMAYAMTIVKYARKCDRVYLVAPLSFSKPNFSKREVTGRVKNIINYKKGTKFTAIITTMLIFAVSTACALDSKSDMNKGAKDEKTAETYEETSELVYKLDARELAFYTAGMKDGEFDTFIHSLDEDALIEYMDKSGTFNIDEDPEYQAMVLDDAYNSLMAKAKAKHDEDTDGTLLFAFANNLGANAIIIYDSATDTYNTFYYDEDDGTVKWKDSCFIHIDTSFLAAEEWMMTYDEFVKVDKIYDFELNYAYREPSWKYVNYMK